MLLSLQERICVRKQAYTIHGQFQRLAGEQTAPGALQGSSPCSYVLTYIGPYSDSEGQKNKVITYKLTKKLRTDNNQILVAEFVATIVP